MKSRTKESSVKRIFLRRFVSRFAELCEHLINLHTFNNCPDSIFVLCFYNGTLVNLGLENIYMIYTYVLPCSC